MLALNYIYSQQVFEEGCQADPGNTGKAGSDVSIVKIADTKSIMAVETSDIVIRAVNDLHDGIICENFSEGLKFLQGYRIDDLDFVTGGYLNQAELLGIVVAAVRLSIEGNSRQADHPLDSDIELRGINDKFYRER
jgi:hypothetical protein